MTYLSLVLLPLIIEVHNVHVTSIGYLNNKFKKDNLTLLAILQMQNTERIMNKRLACSSIDWLQDRSEPQPVQTSLEPV